MPRALNVQLTKIHYYDSKRLNRHIEIATISRKVHQNCFRDNPIVKKNIFGHRWILKVNESVSEESKRKIDAKLVLYILVFASISVAVCSGIYFSLGKCTDEKYDT